MPAATATPLPRQLGSTLTNPLDSHVFGLRKRDQFPIVWRGAASRNDRQWLADRFLNGLPTDERHKNVRVGPSCSHGLGRIDNLSAAVTGEFEPNIFCGRFRRSERKHSASLVRAFQ